MTPLVDILRRVLTKSGINIDDADVQVVAVSGIASPTIVPVKTDEERKTWN